MENSFFKRLETAKSGSTTPLLDAEKQLAFDSNGLILAITQDVDTKQVLMMAWMNIEALKQTLETGLVTYWSRSRSQLWVKGRTSGHLQKLIELRFDCDGDAVLCLVEQSGVACHTGRQSCFYLKASKDGSNLISM